MDISKFHYTSATFLLEGVEKPDKIWSLRMGFKMMAS